MAKYPIDDRTVDRLLSGSLAPEDAPPGYEHVARVVGAVRAPASSAELAAQRSVVSMAAAAVSAPVQASSMPGPHRRKRMVSKLATLRAVAITAAAVLGAGAAAAAATGSLAPASHGSSHAPGLLTAGSKDTTTTSTTLAKGSTTANSNTSTSLPTTGPANVHAVIGLCRAFIEHNSTSGASASTGGAPTTTSNVPENDSTAFVALRKDAGNGTEATVAQTVTWCTTYLSQHSPGNSGTAGNGTAPSGKPATAGNSGNHTSGPPANGNASDPAGHGDSSAGTSTANPASGGASSAGSANAGRR